jgi:hypothetical protein
VNDKHTLNLICPLPIVPVAYLLGERFRFSPVILITPFSPSGKRPGHAISTPQQFADDLVTHGSELDPKAVTA